MATLLEIRNQIKADLDLEDTVLGADSFITDSDINGFINLAIKNAQTHIHDLYEDYFLSYQDIPITANDDLYPFPSDIYANKIRKLIFVSGSEEIFEVRRFNNMVDAESYEFALKNGSNTCIKWMPVNVNDGAVDSALVPYKTRRIQIFPSSGRTGTLKCWYIREVKKLTLDDHICEIDEFDDYIIQKAKTMVYFKDGDARFEMSKALTEELETDMITTLSNMVADDNNEIPIDTSHYWDSDTDSHYGDY